MASSKEQNLSIYGAFYLPLAVLTGLSLISVFLPPALDFLIPAMNSALFISLPQLWNAFLSWVTPPCLFVLLNGIIVLLTASSGALSSSESDSRSDFCTNVLGKTDASLEASSEGSMADPPASDSYASILLPTKGACERQTSADVMMERHHPASSEVVLWAHSAAGRVETYKSAMSRAKLPARTRYAFYDTRGALETEQEKVFEEEGEEDGDDDGKPSNLSGRAMGSRSLSHVQSNARIPEEEEEEEVEKEELNERISGLPKLDVGKKSMYFGCRSEPSSPQFAAQSKYTPIKRSLSVDSVPFHGNQASSCLPEDLSDEAFRKRIEDFISKMNAQLRSEAK